MLKWHAVLLLNIGPAPAISRLGIKPYQWGTECLSGDVSAGPATSFPQSIGMVWHNIMIHVFSVDYSLCNLCRQQASTMTCFTKLLEQLVMK